MPTKPAAALNVLVFGWTYSIQQAHARIGDINITLSDLAEAGGYLPAEVSDFDELNLHISAQCTPKVLCEVQDLLFALLPRFIRGHLQKLNVSFCILVPACRVQGPSVPLIDEFEERKVTKQARMTKLRNLTPGQISELHAVAFLLDPVRAIRALYVRQDGEDNDDVEYKQTRDHKEDDDRWDDELEYETLDVVPNEICKKRAEDDHEKHIKHLRALNKAISLFLGTRDEKASKAMGLNLLSLSELRIRGSLLRFRARHSTVIDLVNGVITEQARKKLTDTEKHARKEIKVLRNKLRKAVPRANANTSYLGYNEADTALMSKLDDEKNERTTRKHERDTTQVVDEATQEGGHAKKRRLIDELITSRQSMT